MPDRFETKTLPAMADAIAPDGSEVRILLRLEQGSMAHFELGPRQVSAPVAHKTIGEIWYFLSGRGQMWRKLGDHEEIVDVVRGVSISIPVGTHFQFRSVSDQPLCAIGQTMPPWPGEDECYPVSGIWEPSLE
ncbi:MAG: cupin domain-containing protein [Gammaproteobacteria bacterium]|nr:cupin domain-containing protein [Gammaproteobacteria bacterium]